MNPGRASPSPGGDVPQMNYSGLTIQTEAPRTLTSPQQAIMQKFGGLAHLSDANLMILLKSSILSIAYGGNKKKRLAPERTAVDIKNILISKKRTKSMLETVDNYIEKHNIGFFLDFKHNEKMSLGKYYKLLNKIKFESHTAGSAVVKIGELGDKFFVIIKGKVSVLIRRKKFDGESYVFHPNVKYFQDQGYYDMNLCNFLFHQNIKNHRGSTGGEFDH
jgi:hypothetical protein